MKYYIIAGEASGDLHASNLMKEIKAKDPQAQFRAWGGDLMQEQGAELVKHINKLAFMGFWEVLVNLPTILKNIDRCKRDIMQWQPDAVIFVDYPGFNLRIARYCKQYNIKTIYYISPQIWAWNAKRINAIRRDIDVMMVILPFEEGFYENHNYKVHFTGHPLLDAMKDIEKSGFDFSLENKLPQKEIVALLPGSRKQEIQKMLPLMARMQEEFPDYQFVIAGTKAHAPGFYRHCMQKHDIPVVYGQTYKLLQSAKAALVTSGTATLETAILKTPQVVCYKAGSISYFIAKRLVKLKYISLVNLIMDQAVVKELIQYDFNAGILRKELDDLLHNESYRKAMLDSYSRLHQKLGGKGASAKAANIVHNFLHSHEQKNS